MYIRLKISRNVLQILSEKFLLEPTLSIHLRFCVETWCKKTFSKKAVNYKKLLTTFNCERNGLADVVKKKLKKRQKEKGKEKETKEND